MLIAALCGLHSLPVTSVISSIIRRSWKDHLPTGVEDMDSLSMNLISRIFERRSPVT